jgi:hypothetical protein
VQQVLATAGGAILLECSIAGGDFTNAGSCWWANFTGMQLLLHAYFTNAGNCWWVNFTGMQLLLHTYFTNAGNCWGANFTGMQLLLHAYFTNAGSCWWLILLECSPILLLPGGGKPSPFGTI